VQIFTREFQRVQDGAMNGGDFPKRAAQPGLWNPFLRHWQWPPSKNGPSLIICEFRRKETIGIMSREILDVRRAANDLTFEILADEPCRRTRT
jgi:hypothetical protein